MKASIWDHAIIIINIIFTIIIIFIIYIIYIHLYSFISLSIIIVIINHSQQSLPTNDEHLLQCLQARNERRSATQRPHVDLMANAVCACVCTCVLCICT